MASDSSAAIDHRSRETWRPGRWPAAAGRRPGRRDGASLAPAGRASTITTISKTARRAFCGRGQEGALRRSYHRRLNKRSLPSFLQNTSIRRPVGARHRFRSRAARPRSRSRMRAGASREGFRVRRQSRRGNEVCAHRPAAPHDPGQPRTRDIGHPGDLRVKGADRQHACSSRSNWRRTMRANAGADCRKLVKPLALR